jgi:hypothetical protein
MRPTGVKFIATGLYEATCRCRSREHFARGQPAPGCPSCGRETVWQIVGEQRPASPGAPRAKDSRSPDEAPPE